MFTGIIEVVGSVSGLRESGDVRRFGVTASAEFCEEIRPGGSIAVDGACLTPVEVSSESFTVEAVGTTLSRTVAGTYREGSPVNLERALAFGGKLDGHLVQGHVDGIGHVTQIRDVDGFHLLEVEIPVEVHALTLLHGSISLNGVSLTVSRLGKGGLIEVALVPYTWDATNLRELGRGDPVNVEGDLIGKYVGKLLRRSGSSPLGGTSDAL